jgi:hypothetical protein
LKKAGRSLGSNSLADKAKKEEIVSLHIIASLSHWLIFLIRGYRREDPEPFK